MSGHPDRSDDFETVGVAIPGRAVVRLVITVRIGGWTPFCLGFVVNIFKWQLLTRSRFLPHVGRWSSVGGGMASGAGGNGGHTNGGAGGDGFNGAYFGQNNNGGGATTSAGGYAGYVNDDNSVNPSAG